MLKTANAHLINATTLLLFAVILANLVEQLQSDNTQKRSPFTRQFFGPFANHRTQEMRTRLNDQNEPQPFKTITMRGGQQFVLVPRRLFFQKRHFFAYRRLLPSPAKFRIRPKIWSHSFETKFKKMPMPKLQNTNRMIKSNPKQLAFPIATNAKNVQKSSANSFANGGNKSGFVPRLINTATQNSLAPFSPRAPAIPQKVSLLQPPPKTSKIRPPIREVSFPAGVQSNFAQMTRKRDQFFNKQRKELKMMRERIERRKMEMERQQQILEEKERMRLLGREKTVPMAPQFGDMRRPQQFHQMPSPPISSSLASPPAAPAPPGQMPPNDRVIDQLNNALDFMDVANRLRLREQFQRRQKVHANA